MATKLSCLISLTLAVTVNAARPNIFLLLTDDQDVILGGLKPMKKLDVLLTQKGTTFSNAMVHTPICCPSRSSYLSGRYLHNSLTTRNNAGNGCANISWANGPEKDTYAVHAKAAGYSTHYAGKYLNAYGLPGSANCETRDSPGCLRTPPGWDDWHGLIGNSRYYNVSIISNGVRQDYGTNTKTDYGPDLFFNHTRDFVANHLATKTNPFLAVLATPSCHGPFTPADKYIGVFQNSSAPQFPDFNHSNEDKQWLMRQLSPITDVAGIDKQHNDRWETLLSVDDYIAAIIGMLEAANQMQNTYFVFTSDNGFQLGNHRLPGDKRHPYQSDLRVPFIIRGPGIAQGVIDPRIIVNVDIAPTFVDIATGSVPDTYDGESMLPMFKSNTVQRSDFMVSYFGDYKYCGLQLCPPPPKDNFHCIDGINNTYACVRTINATAPNLSTQNTSQTIFSDSLYCEFVDSENFVEFYDHLNDPWQLNNLAYTTKPPVMAQLKSKLELFRTCKGKECHQL